MSRSIVIRSLAALALFAVAHSLLAAVPAKRVVRSLAGPRLADGLYRGAYVTVAAASTGLLAGYLWRLPDRGLYRVSGGPRALMMAGQVLGVFGTGAVMLHVGPARFAGVPQLMDLVAGRPVGPPMVAQHPPSAGPDLGWRGPFRLCRHPNNALPLVVWWLSPTMMVKWAIVGLAGAAYMVLGSWHEERRLERAYGEPFRRYRRDVPHLFVPLGWLPTRGLG